MWRGPSKGFAGNPGVTVAWTKRADSSTIVLLALFDRSSLVDSKLW